MDSFCEEELENAKMDFDDLSIKNEYPEAQDYLSNISMGNERSEPGPEDKLDGLNTLLDKAKEIIGDKGMNKIKQYFGADAINKTKGLVKESNKTQKALFINASNKVKVRNIPNGGAQASAADIIGKNCKSVVSSSLSTGPWKGKPITVWYDSSNTVKKNRRVCRLVGNEGLKVNGNVLITGDGITLEDFLFVEKLLLS